MRNHRLAALPIVSFLFVQTVYAVDLKTVPTKPAANKVASTAKTDASKVLTEAKVAAPKVVTPKVVLPKVEVPSRYFVIQNVASEKTRVYERCTLTPDCPHRLVIEADMVVGRPEEGSRHDPDSFKTWVGHSKIKSWVKFYQDRSAHYPHWYKAGQDLATIPPRAPVDASGNPQVSLSWGKAWRVNYNGEETMYGAFGWYAAMLTPELAVSQQWMHGTIGFVSAFGKSICIFSTNSFRRRYSI